MFTVFVALGAAMLAGLFLALLGTMGWGGAQALHTFGWPFLWGAEWNPALHKFAALVPIYGTLVTSAIAMVVAVPVSFGIAVFVTEIAPSWMRAPFGGAIQLLAGIPSIVYGMWGLYAFAPLMAQYIQPWMIAHLGRLPVLGALFQGVPMGIGVLTAGLILAVMVVPFITAVMSDVFQTVPPALKEASIAVGSTTWETIWHVVLPSTRVGVMGGVFLGLGRALGETMAVTFVLGNTDRLSLSLMEPGNSIAAAIANQFSEADSDLYRSALIALGLLLFAITFMVLAAARLMLRGMARARGA